MGFSTLLGLARTGFIGWGTRVAVCAAVSLLLLGGILKCAEVARRRKTSSRCVHGLMLGLAGWLVGVWAFSLADLMEQKFHLPPWLLALLVGGLMLAGMVLGIVGLVEYDSRRFKQGRAQGVAAITLAVLVGCLLLVRTVLSAAEMPDYTDYSLPAAAESPPGEVAEKPPEALAEDTTVFEGQNMRFTAPAEPYVETSVMDSASIARVEYWRNDRKTKIIAECAMVGVDSGLDNRQAVQFIQGKMRTDGGATYSSFSAPVEREISGLQGLQFSAEIVLPSEMFAAVCWVCSHNGYGYQLVAVGPRHEREFIREEADRVFAGFSPIDADRLCHRSQHVYFDEHPESIVKPYGIYSSPLFQYEMGLGGTDWRQWPQLPSIIPHADTGGQVGNAYFTVMAFYLPMGRPPMAVLNQTLLNLHGIPYPSIDVVCVAEKVEDGMECHEFCYNRPVGDLIVEYRVKVLACRQFAYMISTWCPAGDALGRMNVAAPYVSIQFRPSLIQGEFLYRLSEARRRHHAQFFNLIGLRFHEAKQYSQSCAYFKLAAELDSSDPTYFGNALHAYQATGDDVGGLAYIRDNSDRLSGNFQLQVQHAAFLLRTGHEEEAIDIYRRLLLIGYLDDEAFADYVQLLARRKQWDDVDSAFRTYRPGRHSRSLRGLWAVLTANKGDHAKAIELLSALQQEGFSPETAYQLIASYGALGQHRQALEVAQGLLERGFVSVDAYWAKGNAELCLGWYRQAKESFASALALAPDNENLQEALRRVSGMLGQGNNASIREPIEAVSMPDVVADRFAAAQAPQTPGYNVVRPSLIKGVEFDSSGRYRCTIRQRIKVLNADAVGRYSTMRMNFDPLQERLFVNRLVVLDDAGRVVTEGNPDDYYVVDEADPETAAHDQVLHAPVPGLQTGHTIELVVTVLRLGELDRLPLTQHAFSGPEPVQQSDLYVLCEPGQLRYCGDNVPPPVNVEGGVAWLVDAPPVLMYEPLVADFETFLPIMLVASAKDTWEALAGQYLHDIQGKLLLDDDIRALAKSLTDQVLTAEDKLTELIRYVQENLTYKAIAFGPRAWLPNTPAQILANRYGDCKDHAVLLWALLRAVDIPSHPALVSPHQKLFPSVPSLEQFSHMVLYVPGLQGGRFVDTTIKDLDPAIEIPAGLWDRTALVLDGEEPRLLQVGAARPRDCRIRIRRQVAATPEDLLEVREKVEFSGYLAASMRGTFRKLQPADYVAGMQTFLGSQDLGVRVHGVSVDHLQDPRQDFALDIHYDLGGRVLRLRDESILQLPAIWERLHLAEMPIGDRKSPFRLRLPLEIETNTELALASGAVLTDLPPAKQEASGAFGYWQRHVVLDERVMRVKYTCGIRPGLFAKELYAEYQTWTETAATAVAPTVHLRTAEP